MSENTTILVEKKTRVDLKKTARKDQTYNDFIQELLQHCMSCDMKNKKSAIQLEADCTHAINGEFNEYKERPV